MNQEPRYAFTAYQISAKLSRRKLESLFQDEFFFIFATLIVMVSSNKNNECSSLLKP